MTLGQSEILPIESFPGAVSESQPQLYPGLRPENSYLTDGSFVYPMEAPKGSDGHPVFLVQTLEGVRNINDVLGELGLAKMEERIPVIAYGTNLCPSSLAKKFDASEDEASNTREDLFWVPTVYGIIHGYDVVWSDGPGRNGNFIAMLYKGEETINTEAQVGVNFLTVEQLLMLHQGEAAYELASEGTVDLGPVEIPAFFYAGNNPVLLKDGKPVPLKTVSATGREIASATASEVLDYTLQLPAVVHALQEHIVRFRDHVPTVETYTAEAASRKELKDKSELRDIVRDVLGQLGMRATVHLLDTPGLELKPRSLPSQLPTFGRMLTGDFSNATSDLRLPEEETQDLPPARRKKVLRGVRKHWHNNPNMR